MSYLISADEKTDLEKKMYSFMFGNLKSNAFPELWNFFDELSCGNHSFFNNEQHLQKILNENPNLRQKFKKFLNEVPSNDSSVDENLNMLYTFYSSTVHRIKEITKAKEKSLKGLFKNF